MEKSSVDLYTFQTLLKNGVESLFPGQIWVRAEISALKARAGGHCYMELSQSDESGLKAKANAIIWSNRFRFIEPYFRSVTGSALQEGMKILAEVRVNYSQLYGFSLIINDIDADFTLGEKEAEKQRTILRLQEEGLMNRQKTLQMSLLPYNLAVISAEDAAGYGDFIRHLHENEYGFVFHTELFPALMQGTEAPESIIAAINRAGGQEGFFDAILILRGGGAKLDLACFDDYSLAAAIARCPVPVLTAIGHDRDYHVADMVAYANLKTPTALADELIGYYEAEDERISSFGSRLKMAFLNKIAAMSSRIDLLEARIKGADPRNILKRGYVLAVNVDGVVLKSAAEVSQGDRIAILFKDGTVGCTVDQEGILKQSGFVS